jgi:hypothetical protein
MEPAHHHQQQQQQQEVGKQIQRQQQGQLVEVGSAAVAECLTVEQYSSLLQEIPPVMSNFRKAVQGVLAVQEPLPPPTSLPPLPVGVKQAAAEEAQVKTTAAAAWGRAAAAGGGRGAEMAAAEGGSGGSTGGVPFILERQGAASGQCLRPDAIEQQQQQEGQMQQQQGMSKLQEQEQQEEQQEEQQQQQQQQLEERCPGSHDAHQDCEVLVGDVPSDVLQLYQAAGPAAVAALTRLQQLTGCSWSKSSTELLPEQAGGTRDPRSAFPFIMSEAAAMERLRGFVWGGGEGGVEGQERRGGQNKGDNHNNTRSTRSTSSSSSSTQTQGLADSGGLPLANVSSSSSGTSSSKGDWRVLPALAKYQDQR